MEAEITDDEDAGLGYDSDAEDLGKGGRIAKRQKLANNVGEDEEDTDSDGSDEEEEKLVEEEAAAPEGDSSKPPKPSRPAELQGLSKPLTKKNLIKTAAAIKRSGVVYLSRIPPYMKPQKLRTLLEPYGAINRIFLSPEDPTHRKSRLRQGGNKKRNYSDGWVEFVNKADAKRACELLNTRTIGGKKTSFYHDDVWNLLYLKNFKWNNLTEQVAAENAERASRERAELSKTRRETKEYTQNVERAKMLEGMEAKRASKTQNEADNATSDDKRRVKETKSSGERPRHFRQTAAISKRKPENQTEQTRRILSKIF